MQVKDRLSAYLDSFCDDVLVFEMVWQCSCDGGGCCQLANHAFNMERFAPIEWHCFFGS